MKAHIRAALADLDVNKLREQIHARRLKRAELVKARRLAAATKQ